MKQESANEIKNRSKRWIQTALFNLMSTYRYEDINVTMICKEADLTRQTFYRLYESKDMVLKDFMKNLFAKYFTQLEQLQSPTFEELLLSYFNFWKEQKEIVHLLAKNQLLTNTFDSNLKIVEYFIALSHARTTHQFEIFFAGGLCHSTTVWIEEDMKEDVNHIVAEIMKIFKDNSNELSFFRFI